MQLADFLSSENIHICAEMQCKTQLLNFLSKKIANATSLDEVQIRQEFIARETLGSTGLGNGVALPHIRLPNLDTPVAAFFMLRTSIDFDSPDELPVDLVFSLAAPESDTCQHLEILSKIAELFSQPAFREKIRTSHSTMAIYELLQQSQLTRVQL